MVVLYRIGPYERQRELPEHAGRHVPRTGVREQHGQLCRPCGRLHEHRPRRWISRFVSRCAHSARVDGLINIGSVRITSDNNYTGGLFILDASMMPVGCGTWPSFWVRRFVISFGRPGTTQLLLTADQRT